MATGSYEHPAYLARMPILMGRTTAGANGTSSGVALPWPVRIHGLSALVAAAGTSTGSGARLDILVGTSSMGQVALGTSSVGSVIPLNTATDLNIPVPSGSVIYLRNGTDATAAATVVLDATLDATAQWPGV
jgi:hypothetical protein